MAGGSELANRPIDLVQCGQFSRLSLTAIEMGKSEVNGHILATLFGKQAGLGGRVPIWELSSLSLFSSRRFRKK